MDPLKAYREGFRQLPEGCTEAEVHMLSKQSTEVTGIGGELTACSTSEQTMLFVHATGKATGVVCCEDLEEDPRSRIEMALENAAVVSVATPQPLLKDRQDSHVAEDCQPVPAHRLIAFAKEASLLPSVEQCTVSECIRHSVVLNSRGSETVQRQPIYTVSLGVPGKGEDNYKLCSVSRKSLAQIDLKDMMRRVAAEATHDHEDLPFSSLPAGKYDAVLSSAMMVNVMNTAWQRTLERRLDELLALAEQSVLTDVDNCKTPCLVLYRESEARYSREQSEQLYAAMKDRNPGVVCRMPVFAARQWEACAMKEILNWWNRFAQEAAGNE